MRAKLERIAAGKIEYKKPEMTLSESLITLNCKPGEKAEGSFTVTADRQIKGIVYASSWADAGGASEFLGPDRAHRLLLRRPGTLGRRGD